jgi:signal transduction histidine kinase
VWWRWWGARAARSQQRAEALVEHSERDEAEATPAGEAPADEGERARLTRAFDQAPFPAALLLGPALAFVAVNAEYRRQSRRDDLVGRTLREAFPRGLARPMIDCATRALRTGETVVQREVPPGPPGGPFGPLGGRHGHDPGAARERGGRYDDVHYQPVRRADGTVEGVLVMRVDVSEAVRPRLEVEARIAERTAALSYAKDALALEIVERERTTAERDELRRQLASAEEEERRRIARELHDQLGQHLTALTLGLDEARRLVDGQVPSTPSPMAVPARLRTLLAQLGGLAADMTRDARYLALELRPPELDDVGLESALHTYVTQWAARYGIEVELEVAGLAGRRLPGEVGTTLYRIVQEALTNVAKHADASQVSVIVEQPDDVVRLIVEDDGCGFDVEATRARARAERRLGLAGMRERAGLAGGQVTVESTPGDGTTVYVRLPVDRLVVGGEAEPAPAVRADVAVVPGGA